MNINVAKRGRLVSMLFSERRTLKDRSGWLRANLSDCDVWRYQAGRVPYATWPRNLLSGALCSTAYTLKQYRRR